MNILYKEKEIGYTIIVVVIAGILAILYGLIFVKFNWILIMGALLLLLSLFIFYSLKIIITDEKLIVIFGIGIVKLEFFRDEIVECKEVKTHWYNGWGIHLTGKGLLYNVKGFSAVQIKLKNGKSYLIGTSSPDKICDILIKNKK